ncbi:MAG: ribosome biogenesis GTPase Der [bacterium]|nr:ribosome biogenesis GTPase Der [bacterium]
MSHPLVAIIGRPNVGKSALFNRIVGKSIAIVDDMPGITRDRLYAATDWAGREFTLIDTGGLIPSATTGIEAEVRKQAEVAIAEADVIIFLVDAQIGLDDEDKSAAGLLRRQKKKVIVAVNKIDTPEDTSLTASFYKLGLGDPIAISAVHGLRINELLDGVVAHLPAEKKGKDKEGKEIKLAIIGRPNVGKSSIINAILGQERTIVSPTPGTTRDAIDTQFAYNQDNYLLIDTAGIRKRTKVEWGVESFGVIRAMRAIRRADIAALIIDAMTGVTEQDIKIAGAIEQEGTSCVLVVNKWDLVEQDIDDGKLSFLIKEPREKKVSSPVIRGSTDNGTINRGLLVSQAMKQFEHHLRKNLFFLNFAPVSFVSALTGQRVLKILDLVKAVNIERNKRVTTGELNQFLAQVIARKQPPAPHGRPIRLFYMTQVKTRPPLFVLFVNKPDELPSSYRKYILNSLREAFGFVGTPVIIKLRGRKETR